MKNRMKEEKGFAASDALIAVLIIALFAGLIAVISYNIYLSNSSIKRMSKATEYIVDMFEYIDKVYYGCTIADNAMIGFRDQRFDELMGGRKNLLEDYLVQLGHDDCLKLFKDYQNMQHNLY